MNVEQLLRESLEREAQHTEHSPTPVEQVAWRAAKIQRAKRTRTAATALVAAAAVTAVALIAPPMLTAEREADPLEGGRTLASLPTSSPPEVDWIDGDVYHPSGGEDVTLAVRDVQAFVPYRGGLLATLPPDAADGPARLVTLDPAGQVVSEDCGSPRLALDEHGAVLLRATVFQCRPEWDSGVTLVWDDVREPSSADDELASPIGYRTDPVAVRGDLTYYNSTAANVRMARRDAGPLPYVAEYVFSLPTGLGPPDQVPGLKAAADVTLDGRWIAGTTRDGRQVIVEAGTGEIRTELIGRPIAFSPDDRLVAAVRDDDTLMILDVETGEPLTSSLEDIGSVTGELAWESSTELVAVAEQDGQEAVVRVDNTGNVTRTSQLVDQGSIALVTQP